MTIRMFPFSYCLLYSYCSIKKKKKSGSVRNFAVVIFFFPSFSFLSKALFWEILIRNSPSACSPAVLLLALDAGTLTLQPFCWLGAGTPPV